jgi:gliding motility-associated lipoprotein GldD
MKSAFYIVLCFILLTGCSSGGDYSPKPRGFFRISFPEKKYQTYKSECNYTFQYPVYASILADKAKNAQPCWIDVSFPDFNSKIHLSYQAISSKKQFNALVEDARSFAFKHTVKATAINEGHISYPESKVYGTYYKIKGNTASAVQFFLTDSSSNYLRGALYFFEQPRQDSIKPVLDFLEKDINVMIKSFRWK